MAICPQRLTIYLYSVHRAVIFAIAQLSCLVSVFNSSSDPSFSNVSQLEWHCIAWLCWCAIKNLLSQSPTHCCFESRSAVRLCHRPRCDLGVLYCRNEWTCGCVVLSRPRRACIIRRCCWPVSSNVRDWSCLPFTEPLHCSQFISHT